MATSRRPNEITLHQNSCTLEIAYSDTIHKLSCEFLRVHSPSAEVKGHGPGQEVLQTRKANIGITAIDAIGNYAVQLHFDDGHNTGIYTWEYLYDLGSNMDVYWSLYLEKLSAAGEHRDPHVSTIVLN